MNLKFKNVFLHLIRKNNLYFKKFIIMAPLKISIKRNKEYKNNSLTQLIYLKKLLHSIHLEIQMMIMAKSKNLMTLWNQCDEEKNTMNLIPAYKETYWWIEHQKIMPCLCQQSMEINRNQCGWVLELLLDKIENL